MKTHSQSLIRVAALAISAWAFTGAAAFAEGSEFSSLSEDPLEEFFGEESDVDLGDITLGPNNNAVIVQKGQASNHIELEQDGDGNLMISSQNSVVADNRAAIVQSGNDNASFLRQDGSNNEYDLLQAGDNNVSAATQYGDNNAFEHIQNGSNLGLAVTQYGNSAIMITQTGN